MINDGGRFRKLFLRLLLLHLLSCILKGGFLRHILFGATALFCLYEGCLSRAVRLVAVVSVRSLHLDDFILAKGQTANLCLSLVIRLQHIVYGCAVRQASLYVILVPVVELLHFFP